MNKALNEPSSEQRDRYENICIDHTQQQTKRTIRKKITLKEPNRQQMTGPKPLNYTELRPSATKTVFPKEKQSERAQYQTKRFS